MNQSNKMKAKDNRMMSDELRGQATAYQILFNLFIEALVAEFSPNKGIIIDSTNHNILLPWDKDFDGLSARVRRIVNGELVGETEQTSLTSIAQTYGQNDLVIRFCPIGLIEPRYKLKDAEADKVPAEYQEIWDNLNIIGENGLVFVNTTFGLFTSRRGTAFQSMLKQKGYYIGAVIEFPSRIYPDTGIPPLVVAITKKSFNDRLFIAEVNASTNFNAVIRNFKEIRSADSIYEGVITEFDSFTSISNYKTIQQINNLRTYYQAYKKYTLKEVALDVRTTREHFTEELEGAIYIPQLGNSSPVASLSKTTLKHQNYFQVLLDSEKVLSKYLEVFFKSELGKLSLESLIKGSVIGYKAKSDLLDLALPIPDLPTQELLVTTYEKIEQLRQSVTSFESELSLNPDSATLIQESLDSVLQSLGKLREEDQLLALIRGGESGTLEFKQTFTKDVETGIKEKEKSIRKSSLKNIVGFLNSNGGTLIIGVKDDRTIVGIEADYFENDDKYLLNFKNQIKEKIGEESYSYLKWRIVSVQGKRVLAVECMPASTPFFLEDTEFYVRTNPSVDKLEGSKLARYLQQRFSNK